MLTDIETPQRPASKDSAAKQHFYRFHAPHLHLHSVFGDDRFALKAEAFARFIETLTLEVHDAVVKSSPA
jgi:hypothetical protein